MSTLLPLRKPTTPLVRYGLAVGLTGGFLLLRLALQPWLGLSVPYTVFVPAIMLAARFGGLGSGVLTTVLSAALADYLFLSPLYSLRIDNIEDLLSLPLFIAVGVAVSSLTESLHRSEKAQRHAARRADEQARELDAMFQAIPDGVYVGTADRITHANAAGLRMLGARSLWDLNARTAELQEEFAIRAGSTGARLSPEQLPFSRALRGEVVAEEIIARRADTGEDVVLRSSAAPIWGDGRVVGAVAVNADMTEQHEAARRLQEATEAASKARLRLGEVVANVPGVVWEAWGRPGAPSRRVDFVSDYVQTMLGYSPEQWTSSPNFWLTVVHPDDRERAEREAVAIFESNGPGRSEFRWVHRDGRVLWVEARSTVIQDGDGKPVGMRGVTLDITDRKKLEQERADLLKREQAARAEAVSANRLKDDFLATLSHELRTPLNAVLGYTRMLRDGAVDAARLPRALEIVERNATALTQMVEDVLDVSRIISGKIRLNVRAVDLANVVEESVSTMKPAAQAKGVRIEMSIDAGVGPVMGDADRLQQVIWNLLSNAVRFTPEAGRVEVRLERSDSHAEIVVADTGAGISPEFLPHVFERFRQADSGFAREYGGLGLGLAISHDIIDLHGGTIQARSDGAGKGASFRVRLPLPIERQLDRGRPGVGGSARPGADRDLHGLRILVVDDDQDARTLMLEVLESAGAIVASAESAPEALSLMARNPPDAIVTDLGLPGMDGFQLLAEVRKSPIEALRNVPAAAVTAYARSEDRFRSLRSGFQMHLAKPIDPAELVTAVAALARRKT